MYFRINKKINQNYYKKIKIRIIKYTKTLEKIFKPEIKQKYKTRNITIKDLFLILIKSEFQ